MLLRVLRARGGRFATRSPWICWHAARAAPLPFVQLARDQNKQNPRLSLLRDATWLAHVPGGENALKKPGRHWNAAKCIQKRIFWKFAWSAFYAVTCMLTCRWGSAVNARVVYWDDLCCNMLRGFDSSRWSCVMWCGMYFLKAYFIYRWGGWYNKLIFFVQKCMPLYF